jgi:hypothetical protein
MAVNRRDCRIRRIHVSTARIGISYTIEICRDVVCNVSTSLLRKELNLDNPVRQHGVRPSQNPTP